MKRCLWLAALFAAACASRGSVKVIQAPPRPLLLPTPVATPAAERPSFHEVLVIQGDSFWRLARRELGSGTRYGELAEFNGLKAESLIRPGQRLRVPGPAGAGKALPPPNRPRASARARKAADPWPKRENHAYAVGEKLSFAVQYLGITAGYAVLSIPEYSSQDGRLCLHVMAEARTHPFFEKFITVKDRIETFIDADSLFSWRYEKHIREGGHSADAFYVFDQRAQMMHEPAKGKDVTVSAETQDVLSCFFWFRTMDLTLGNELSIKVAADDMKSYDLKVKVLRREKVSTLAGDFDCVLVQPKLEFEGIFQKKGEALVWITDDPRHIPVKIQAAIPVLGKINITLQDAEWVQPN